MKDDHMMNCHLKAISRFTKFDLRDKSNVTAGNYLDFIKYYTTLYFTYNIYRGDLFEPKFGN